MKSIHCIFRHLCRNTSGDGELTHSLVGALRSLPQLDETTSYLSTAPITLILLTEAQNLYSLSPMVVLWVHEDNYHLSLLRNFRPSGLIFFSFSHCTWSHPHPHPLLSPFLTPTEENCLSSCSKLTFPPMFSTPSFPALPVTLVIELKNQF